MASDIQSYCLAAISRNPPAKTEEEQDQITVVSLWWDARDKTQKAKLISSWLNRRVECVNNDTLAI